MINFHIPDSYVEERTYIIEVLFEEFLGIPFDLHVNSSIDNYEIDYEGKKLIVMDSFFTGYKQNSYLSSSALPQNIKHFSNNNLQVKMLPVLYGDSEIIFDQDDVICHIDLFASAYFMLTRWEEFVVKKRDVHGRFSAKDSVAFKNAFLDRAVVNEYVELLWKLLQKISPVIARKSRAFRLVPTHDVDHLILWKSGSSIRKRIAHNVITQNNFINGVKNAVDAARTVLGLKDDPYDTFEYIMGKSEESGVQSRFYILGGGVTKYDKNFDTSGLSLIKVARKMLKRGHIVGYHPNYSAFEEEETWEREKLKLEKSIGEISLKEGRHHYLRVSVPDTWQVWDNNGMEIDSTLGYHDYPGFRTGCCYPYSTFNFVTKKKLKLKEMPLLFMEVSVIEYMRLGPEQAYSKAEQLYKEVKKFNGDFVFLWHNSSLFTAEFKPYVQVYESIMKNFK